MRYLTAFLTFAIGVTAAGIVSSLFSYSVDAVPAIKTEVVRSPLADLDKQAPRYTPFAKSAALFGFYGWFVTDEFEGMPEVWAIQLSHHAKESNVCVRTLPVGKEAEDQVAFTATKVDLDGEYFGFKTENIGGVHYEFNGRFLYGGSAFEQEEKVLSGTLKKFRKGKLVAKFTTTFSYAEPYCTL